MPYAPFCDTLEKNRGRRQEESLSPVLNLNADLWLRSADY